MKGQHNVLFKKYFSAFLMFISDGFYRLVVLLVFPFDILLCCAKKRIEKVLFFNRPLVERTDQVNQYSWTFKSVYVTSCVMFENENIFPFLNLFFFLSPFRTAFVQFGHIFHFNIQLNYLKVTWFSIPNQFPLIMYKKAVSWTNCTESAARKTPRQNL